MPSIFTRIINGELPGRFVWKDDQVVAFLSINPLRPGHTLVVPRAEVEHWVDLPAATSDHLFRVASIIGKAINAEFKPTKVGMTLIGLEVPHVHVHLVPIDQPSHMDFKNADTKPEPAALDAAAERIRTALRAMGRTEVA